MERLTVRGADTIHENGVGCAHFGGLDCYTMTGHCSDGCPWEEKAWERLAAYEETGLTPEEINHWFQKWKDAAEIAGEIKAAGFDRLRELAEADQEGRCVVLPKPGDSEYDGLRGKYRVYKVKNNEPVENCFVLRPDKDKFARVALLAYASTTDNAQLSKDIIDWVERMAALKERENNAAD